MAQDSLETKVTKQICFNISDTRPESWVALGHYCHLNKNFKRAVYFAYKVLLLFI